MLRYQEIPPSPALADRIECFWTMRADSPGPLHRVVPDGCADILLTVSDAAVSLDAVGPMTRYRDHEVVPGRVMFGARFRPGRWPAEHIPDTTLPLEDLWGKTAKPLLDRLAHTTSPLDRARIVEAALPPDDPGPVERAVAFLERAAGQITIEDLAREANLSPRQFRRLCFEKAGYTPKFLARVLRFRRAASRLAAGVPAADVAVDCGYYDQPHLINEYRVFSGRSPGAFSASNSASSVSPR